MSALFELRRVDSLNSGIMDGEIDSFTVVLVLWETTATAAEKVLTPH